VLRVEAVELVVAVVLTEGVVVAAVVVGWASLDV
jgi:hypothetical protein